MDSKRFRSRLAWCNVGSWGQTRDQALDKCEALVRDVMNARAGETDPGIHTGRCVEQLQHIVSKIRATRPSNFLEQIEGYHEHIDEVIRFEHSIGQVVPDIAMYIEDYKKGIEPVDMVADAPQPPPPPPVVRTRSTTCSVCLNSEKTHAFLCGHKCVCASCAARCQQCPLCRDVSRAIRIFE